ncbi:MAG: aminotransferase class V-fold PLP-dependent enzyme [Deltaproteobacteria bacterium]
MIESISDHQLFLLPNVNDIRAKDFPLFETKRRIYLDSTATSQEPQSVKNIMHEYRSNTIRGSNHSKNSQEARTADQDFEESRLKLSDFFNAGNYILCFTSGTTDSSNWIATRFPFEKDDLLVLTNMEHNSQIVTCRNLAHKHGVKIEYIPENVSTGQIDLEILSEVINKHRKGKILLNLVHASNVTGIINPVAEARKIIGDRGYIYLDMAQSAGHLQVDLDELDVDFAGISAHKMYGPTGVGAIFINKSKERFIPNTVSGGSAVKLVAHHITAYCDGHARFEPGTQDIEGVIEWGFAIDYLREIGMEKICAHDSALGQMFFTELLSIPQIKVLGPQEISKRGPVVTFTTSTLGMDHERIACELDKYGISVRDGCFCAHIYVSQKLGAPDLVHELRTGMMKLGLFKDMLMLPGAVRASFAFYNTPSEVTRTADVLRRILKVKRKIINRMN